MEYPRPIILFKKSTFKIVTAMRRKLLARALIIVSSCPRKKKGNNNYKLDFLNESKLQEVNNNNQKTTAWGREADTLNCY